MARRVAASIGVPFVELDSIYHQAGWTPLPDGQFRSRVLELANMPGWAVCGNYRAVADILVDRADTLVVFDLPKRVVMGRVVRRTFQRAALRTELWNGNKERWRSILSRDPQTSIILWAWTTHGRKHDEMLRLIAAPPSDDLRLVHIASLADERLFYAGLCRPTVSS